MIADIIKILKTITPIALTEEQWDERNAKVALELKQLLTTEGEPVPNVGAEEMLIKYTEYLHTEMNYTTDTDFDAETQVEVFMEQFASQSQGESECNCVTPPNKEDVIIRKCGTCGKTVNLK